MANTDKPKNIYRRHELPQDIVEYLESKKDALLKEFLDYHPDFVDGEFKKGVPFVHADPNIDVTEVTGNAYAWKMTFVKYNFARKNISFEMDKDVKPLFPVACEIAEHFGDICPIATYSVLEANSKIDRHTGPENRENDYIRIHLPLLVPEGDIFFEVLDEEITWESIFGFDNQKPHSAWNHSPHRRLVYFVDLKRTAIGLPQGEIFTKEQELATPPFVRKKVAA
jgi:hypothetical protein